MPKKEQQQFRLLPTLSDLPAGLQTITQNAVTEALETPEELILSKINELSASFGKKDRTLEVIESYIHAQNPPKAQVDLLRRQYIASRLIIVHTARAEKLDRSISPISVMTNPDVVNGIKISQQVLYQRLRKNAAA